MVAGIERLPLFKISGSTPDSRGGSWIQQHLFNYFYTSGHTGFLDDISITFIDKTDPSDPLKREDYLKP